MYKNIIFDIGNVILDFNPKRFLSSKFKESEKVLEIYREVFESQEWLMLDRGIITEEEAKIAIIKRSKNNASLIPLAFENWYDLLVPIEGTVEIIKSLKECGFNLYYLSNFHYLAFKHIIKKYDFFKLFDGGVISYEEKVLKPEEVIYKRLIDKYILRPEECIFIDDVASNIEVAKKVSMETVLFTNAEALKQRLYDFRLI